MSVNDLAARFRALHRDGFFILPNAWDAASAALIAAAGAKAIGTTSSGVSWALGAPEIQFPTNSVMAHWAMQPS